MAEHAHLLLIHYSGPTAPQCVRRRPDVADSLGKQTQQKDGQQKVNCRARMLQAKLSKALPVKQYH